MTLGGSLKSCVGWGGGGGGGVCVCFFFWVGGRGLRRGRCEVRDAGAGQPLRQHCVWRLPRRADRSRWRLAPLFRRLAPPWLGGGPLGPTGRYRMLRCSSLMSRQRYGSRRSSTTWAAEGRQEVDACACATSDAGRAASAARQPAAPCAPAAPATPAAGKRDREGPPRPCRGPHLCVWVLPRQAHAHGRAKAAAAEDHHLFKPVLGRGLGGLARAEPARPAHEAVPRVLDLPGRCARVAVGQRQRACVAGRHAGGSG